MVKFTYRPVEGPDDPIFDGRIVISSHKRKPKDKPQERFPDLQNLPFDPAEEFLKKLKD